MKFDESKQTDYDSIKVEDRLVEEVKELLLNHEQLHEHIVNKIKSYGLDFDIDEAMTEEQMEIAGQYQVVEFQRFLALVIAS